MAGLIDMIVNNPDIVNSIAEKEGISIGDAGSIIGQLAPILMGATKENLRSDRDSGDILNQISDSQFPEMYDKPQETVQRGDLGDLGNIILGQMTGSKENSRKVAKHVEQQTGMNLDIIKSILPMIAPFIIGAIGKMAAPTINTQNQNRHASGGGGLEDILIGMMDQDHDGSVIDDIGGMIMKQIFS